IWVVRLARLTDSDMSAVTLALAIIIVILLYLLLKKYGSEAPSASSSKTSVESLAEKNRYTEEQRKRIKSEQLTKESSTKIAGSKEATSTKAIGSKESVSGRDAMKCNTTYELILLTESYKILSAKKK
uniref:Uncharacterized protein n=1 Tax=Parascaris univalens TaxID=6257 RepID=A0A915BVH7_PARUN